MRAMALGCSTNGKNVDVLIRPFDSPSDSLIRVITMKKIYTFIVPVILTILTNYTFAIKETWHVDHNETCDKSTGVCWDDGVDYIVKPVGNGYCLYHNGTTPRSIAIHSVMEYEKKTSGEFQINFISYIFKKCGSEHSSQDFEVRRLKDNSLAATFQWYSPYAKTSYIKAINDPDHIVSQEAFGIFVVGKTIPNP